MNTPLHQLAQLTGLRDRQHLDASLAQALQQLVSAQEVTIAHRVGPQHDARWAVRANLNARGDNAPADADWAGLEELPPADCHPLWQRCLADHCTLHETLPGSGTADTLTVPPRYATVFPMRAEADTAGVVELVTRQPLEERDQRSACLLMQVHHNVQSLLDYGEQDTLTGLFNRKTFDDALLKASTAASQLAAGGDTAAASWWLAVVDIDFFKRVNDNYGHLIGDEVLLLVGQMLRNSFRQGDRAFRFGGEEFVILLRCAGAANALSAMERLRASIEAYTFPQVGRITISSGLTAICPGDVPSAVIERADRALYFAKQHGRNQVQFHADLVRSGLLEGGTKTGAVELF